jgi:mannose-1-phosphate guanylyltransferase
MEKAEKVCCVASDFSWNDVGGWLALKSSLTEDKAGNYCRGQTLTLDATGNLVFSQNPDETIVLVGVEDLVIVRAGGKTLVTHKDRTEDIKKLVERMNEETS